MRRRYSTLVPLLLAILCFTSGNGSAIAQTDPLGESRSPLPGFTVWQLDTMSFGGDWPAYETMVLVEPGTPVDHLGHPHMGNFLLTVESGAICYRQGELGIDASGEPTRHQLPRLSTKVIPPLRHALHWGPTPPTARTVAHLIRPCRLSPGWVTATESVRLITPTDPRIRKECNCCAY